MTLRIVAASLLVLLAAPPLARAQAAPPADPIRELLDEVRGLRAALERAATVSARIQLLIARVQIQETRIAELTRRGDSIRAELGTIDQQLDAAAMQQKLMTGNDPDVKPEERKEFAVMLQQFALQAERLEKRKQELMLEEGSIAQQISLDQGRWSDINSQLDQLERSLTVKQ